MNIYTIISKHRLKLMGIAALWIYVFHAWLLSFSNIPVIGRVEVLIKSIGFLGVDFFFFLSGMGLPKSYEKSKNIFDFYKKRLKRIIIPYFIISIVIAYTKKWSIIEYLLKFFGVDFYTKSVYSLLWFIPAIMTIYLLFPLYYNLLNRTKSKNKFIIFSLLIWLTISLLMVNIMREDLYCFTNRIPVFLIGIWLYENKDKIYNSLQLKIIICLMLIFGLVTCYLTNVKEVYIILPLSNRFLPNLLLTLSLCPILSYIFEKTGNDLFINKIINFYGSISLEMYCLQEYLRNTIIQPILGEYPNVIINIGFIILLSLLSYLLNILNVKIWSRYNEQNNKMA